ncbi:MAG: hypothetical protein AAB425_11725, partial [Bdellovibrionota bacterium]
FNQGVREAELVELDYLVTTLHEMAHQFQYWHSNPYRSDLTPRRTELVADCVAGAYATALLGLSPDSPIVVRMADTAAAAGDNGMHDTSHHGKPSERRLMIRAGAWVTANVSDLRTTTVLRECSSMIETLDSFIVETVETSQGATQ